MEIIGLLQEKKLIYNHINWKLPGFGHVNKEGTCQKVKMRKKRCEYRPEPQVFLQLSEGIPRNKEDSGEKNNLNEFQETLNKGPIERIDIYYFDHGNSAYYRTTDCPPMLSIEKCAERMDNAATRFWAEIFGIINIGLAFVIAFILQLLRFLLYALIRPLTVGILQILADYFIKPLLSIIFNALIQPFLILFYNVATSFRDLCEPIAEALGFFFKEIQKLLGAFRIIEIHQNEKEEKKVITSCT